MNLDNFAGKALTKRGHVCFRSHRLQVGGDNCVNRQPCACSASVNEDFLMFVIPEPRLQSWAEKME